MKYFYLFVLVAFTNSLFAQDALFSQFKQSPLNLNPALTGIFKGDMRATGNVRSQWYSVPVSYLSFSGAYETKFYDKNLKTTLFSGGLMFNYDQAGYSKLSLSSLTLSTSLTQQLGEKNFLTLGAQLSANQRAFSLDNLSFDNQFDGDQFNETLDSRETFDKTNKFYGSFSAGMNWHYQIPDKRTRADVGFAVFHINQPEVSFMGDEKASLRPRVSFYGNVDFAIGGNTDLTLNFSSQSQGESRALLLGTGMRVYLNQTPTRELSVQPGFAFRLGDALIPSLDIQFGAWNAGLSYDVNISDFRAATNSSGAIEASIMYIFTRVKPVDEQLICPIF